MKKVLFILFALLAFGAKAQFAGSGQKVYSKAAGDSILVPAGAIEILPVIANAKGDTAISLTWRALDVRRVDTTAGCNTYVVLFDKKGGFVADFNQPIPASVVNVWGVDPWPIDDYIFQKNPRFKRVIKK